MRIEKKDLKNDHGNVKVVPESSDDLWHLEHIIDSGDIVSAVTERKLEGPDQVERSSNVRETMSVELEVEKVELDDFSNRLRISGIIKECDKKSEIGRHHTINIEPRKQLEIEKKWKERHLESLEEAGGETPEVIVLTVEEGEAYIHNVSHRRVDEIYHLKGSTGKGEGVDRNDLFREILSVLENIDEADGIILAGPGFVKREVMEYIEENNSELSKQIVIEDTASVGGRGVHEVLKKGTVEKISKEMRVEKQANLLDELLERVARGGDAVFGQTKVEKAANQGAIEELLVVEEIFRQNEEFESIVRTTERKGGDVTFFSMKSEPGQQLEGLGGIAALLRYKI